MRFENKVAVVTGASLGIGRALAATYARESAQVAIVSNDKERGEATAAERQVIPPGRS
jgi:NAD(P)-dependent dehydrogenase (short-subunit alcohol dehydrogenase family)